MVSCVLMQLLLNLSYSHCHLYFVIVIMYSGEGLIRFVFIK